MCLRWSVIAMVVTVNASPIHAQAELPAPAIPSAGTRDSAIPVADPIFDLNAIATEPLDAVITKSTERDGIVTQAVEFTSRTVAGQPERISGILAFPKGAESKPALLWCMGGMAAASEYWPQMFARKGYAAISITLRHELRRSFEPFNAADPKNANLTLCAVDHMRAITYLTQRPEVDGNRIGVAGASYGGFFATLVAGADPRVKAGMSYFAGGHHELGTNLPQFTGMAASDAIAVWMKTIDPAWRLSQRDVPFMWGVAANDNWFSLPAVTRTYQEAKSKGKRMVIMPHWQHGFPPEVDTTLYDFLDTQIGGTKKPYNQPSSLRIEHRNGKVTADWSWTGERKIVKAELIVSYGPSTPWLGWQHRASAVIPAPITGTSAAVALPVPERDIVGIAWANITDESEVTTSTEPVEFNAARWPKMRLDKNFVMNGFPRGDLSDADLHFFKGQAIPLTGEPDKMIKHSGAQSLRIGAPPGAPRIDTPISGPSSKASSRPVEVRVHHVPMHAHKATIWLRADKPTKLHVSVVASRPAHWKSPIVRSLVESHPTTRPLLQSFDTPLLPIAPTVVAVGTEWRQVVLNVPYDGSAIENYSLVISQPQPGNATWWYDSVRFEAIWEHK